MKRQDVKSHCPINITVEVFGDPWSLLIMREIAFCGTRTFGDLLRIPEFISTSVLTDRLRHLQSKGIITRRLHATDKRKSEYQLTPIGVDSLPILYEVAAWGSRTSPDAAAPEQWFAALELNKQAVLDAWRTSLESGSAFLAGPRSVVNQLNLEGET